MPYKLIIKENGKVYATGFPIGWTIEDIADIIIGVDTIRCNFWCEHFLKVPYTMDNTPENIDLLKQFSSLKD